MAPYWHAKAHELRAENMTFAEIARQLGRSTGRVHRVLTGSEKERHRESTPHEDSDETKRRRLVRRWCRRNAARLGKTHEELYAEYGVADLDRAAAYDARRK